jgi:hypothetical protein
VSVCLQNGFVHRCHRLVNYDAYEIHLPESSGGAWDHAYIPLACHTGCSSRLRLSIHRRDLFRDYILALTFGKGSIRRFNTKTAGKKCEGDASLMIHSHSMLAGGFVETS